MFDELKDAYNKYVLMDVRMTQLEKDVAKLQKQIAENAHLGRVCPGCGEKSLQFPNKEYPTLAYSNYITGETRHTTAKKLFAVCKSCGWESDDQEFIKNCLHKL